MREKRIINIFKINKCAKRTHSEYMLSNVAVNSSGEMVSPCLTPLLILIFLLSLCGCTVNDLSVYMSFRNSMYTYSIPCSCNDVDIASVCTESNAF